MAPTPRRWSLARPARILSHLLTVAACTHPQPRAGTPEPASSQESFAGRSVHVTPALREGVDELARRAAAQLQVPGAALAVVHGGEVVLEQCWGDRTLGGEPVTEDTLFMIGSITKPMTTMLQAVLADEGRVRWTAPLHVLLPELATETSSRWRELSLWHASCACSGMPASDMENLFEYANVSAEQRVRALAALHPTAAIGERYQYSNLMVAVGGYAAAHASEPELELGAAYERAMQRHVLDPIGMSASTFDFARVDASEHALPHALDLSGHVRVVPLSYERTVLPIRPAGGLWTSLRDMERYAMTELARGVAPGGRRVVSAQNLEERWELRVREQGEDGYGLGMGLGRAHGLRVLSHSGGSLGFGATLFMLPDQDLAVVILTNVRNGGPYAQLPFNEVLLERVLELLFDAATARSDARLEELASAQAETIAALSRDVEQPPDRGWLETLRGSYHEPRLGRVQIGIEGALGVFDAGEWKSRFARRVAEAGQASMIFVDPPFAGTPLRVVQHEGKPSFVVEEGDTLFEFVRTDAP